MKDLYAVLGTDINCGADEIREAYRKLSKKFHPDMNGNDSYFENRFREIREAYETLSDAPSRSRYDAMLKKSGLYAPGGMPAKRPWPKNRIIDIFFTITLVIITSVFGSYVYRAMMGSKTAAVNKTAIVSAAPAHAVKHHKKKHNLKPAPITSKPAILPPQMVKTTVKPVKVIADTASIHPVKIVPVVNKTAYKAPVDNTPKPADKILIANASKPIIKTASANIQPVVAAPVADASYTTSIKANITGVVYLKKAADYAADVVKVIPNNARVVVLEKGSVFYKVQYNDATGYVPRWTITDK